MKNKLFLTILVVFLGGLPLGAQQEGSVAIAGNIRSADESAVFTDFPACVERLVKSKTKEGKAIKACTKIAELAAHTSTRIANEAADATKSSRPLVVNNGWGYGYGFYGGGYSYYPVVRRTVVVRRHGSVRRSPPPVNRSPVRSVRPAPSPSRPPSRSR